MIQKKAFFFFFFSLSRYRLLHLQLGKGVKGGQGSLSGDGAKLNTRLRREMRWGKTVNEKVGVGGLTTG